MTTTTTTPPPYVIIASNARGVDRRDREEDDKKTRFRALSLRNPSFRLALAVLAPVAAIVLLVLAMSAATRGGEDGVRVDATVLRSSRLVDPQVEHPLPSRTEEKEFASSSSSSPNVDSARRCTASEADLQEKYMEAAKVRGCPAEDDVWMRMVNLVMPQAKVFIDIGSNKGFTAARFYELWNPELGLNARVLHESIRKTSPRGPKDLLECGACSDCREISLPLVPRTERFCGKKAGVTMDNGSPVPRAVEGFCALRRAGFTPVRVYSFDGNPDLVDGVAAARDHLVSVGGVPATHIAETVASVRLPPRESGIGLLTRRWTLENVAFLDRVEDPHSTVEFVLGMGETGSIAVNGGSTLAGSTAATATHSPTRIVRVPAMTVDGVLERESLDSVDVLKIDVEGFDAMVLDGARRSLARHAFTLVIFEYNKHWVRGSTLERAAREVMEPHGYACWIEGKNSLLKITHGCWRPQLEMRKWLNVWCASTRKPAGVALGAIFDSYTVAFSATS